MKERQMVSEAKRKEKGGRSYYQVVIDGKVFPYEGCRIWNKESAKVYLKQAETVVKTHIEYKDKNCKVELVRVESI